MALAAGVWFGWQGWQDSQRASAEAASLIYQDLVEASNTANGEALSDDSRATATHLAGQLKEEYSSSLYAQNAVLFLAKLAVEERQLEKAAAER